MTAQVINSADWQLQGRGRMTDAQRRLLNAACGDLAKHLRWHGRRWTKDSYRHFFSGIVLGADMVPSVDMGHGPAGFVMMHRSSLEMSMSQATDAIQMAFYVGDCPDQQGLKSAPVRWCDVVCLARGISDSERLAA
ncbi:recombination protein NinB [Dyella halodurans]|uniref:Recombination protein NinB n=1 Tax=Dyella halodurans TaxID=1920171 RepID=A0ABV9C0D9_9GAMM|nr:recombination protein NinB [Dyella halodurans]